MRCLLVLLCLASAPLAAEAQGVVSFPEPTRVTGGDICVRAAPLRVCRRATDEGGRVVVSRGGREAVTWAASSPGIVDDLRVFRLESGLVVVAVLDAVSNGIAIATWTLTVTDGRRVLYRFVARDFDPEGGSFGVWDRQPVLWATEWHDSEDPSGRRGPGYYLVGRPFRFGASELVPVTGLPLRARRLLFSFERGAGGAVRWLSDRRAQTRRRDPFWSGRPRGTPGVISTIDLDAETPSVTVRAGGRDVDVGLDSWGGGEGTGRLGDGVSGRLFPPEYVPADAVGRPVRVGPGPAGSRILWLD